MVSKNLEYRGAPQERRGAIHGSCGAIRGLCGIINGSGRGFQRVRRRGGHAGPPYEVPRTSSR
jgi:hypothetical protein